MAGEVVLSAALRSNLLSLQRTQTNIDKVQNVLATGLKVSSALDNPQSFFASQSLKNRSSDLGRLLDGIGQSIQTIKTADAGVTGLTKLVEQASSIVDSARDAITNGAKEASITGNVNLKNITSTGGTGGLTGLTGISASAELAFTVKKADGSAVVLTDPGTGRGTVAIANGDSIDQLITKINDLVNTATGEQAIKAELTSAGYLKLTALDGGTVNVAFDANGTGVQSSNAIVPTDQAFASALGFGSLAQKTEAGVASATQQYTTSVTAVATTKLVSGVFYNNGGTGFSDASDLLTAVDDSDAGGTTRFVASATETSGIMITINGSKTMTSKVNIAGTTVQGLVDAINNDASIGSLVEASYDKETGQFSIEALSSTVSTIKVETKGLTDGTANTKADFDFGTATSFTPGAASMNTGETFTLASAASLLSQYESDYNNVREQINSLVEDSDYRGVNLINGDTLETYFNEDRSNKLSTTGSDLSSSGLGLLDADFSRLDTIEAASSQTNAALSTLRAFGGTLANSLSIIQTRQDFTKSLIETLDEGSDKLTLADQNEEGAKLLALQTRQQLGVTALSLAAQAQQSVLRLF